MQVKEVYVALDEAVDCFNVINNTLKEIPDTQVFIEESVYERLVRDDRVRKINGIPSGHYKGCEFENSEDMYDIKENSNWNSPVIFGASFITNCLGFKQLVLFKNFNDKFEYKHYYNGMEQLLLIKENK